MQPPIPPPTPPAYGGGKYLDPQEQEARNWAVACHLSSLSAYLGIPFGHVVGPLVIWLMKKDQMPLVADQAREALNFNITITILGAFSLIGAFFLIGIPALLLLPVVHLIFTIVAAFRASAGEVYRYPFNIRFIS